MWTMALCYAVPCTNVLAVLVDLAAVNHGIPGSSMYLAQKSYFYLVLLHFMVLRVRCNIATLRLFRSLHRWSAALMQPLAYLVMFTKTAICS